MDTVYPLWLYCAQNSFHQSTVEVNQKIQRIVVTCEAPKSLQVDYTVATTKHAYATHIDSYPGQDLSAAAHGKDSGTILIVSELRGQREHLGNYLVLHTLQQPPASICFLSPSTQSSRLHMYCGWVIRLPGWGEGSLGVYQLGVLWASRYGSGESLRELKYAVMQFLLDAQAIPIRWSLKHTHSPPDRLYVLIEHTQINMTLWRNSKSSIWYFRRHSLHNIQNCLAVIIRSNYQVS